MSVKFYFWAFVVALSPCFSIAEETVKIGALLPLTGPLASFGEIVRQGIESADTQSAKIVFEDDQCRPEKAVSAYTHLSSIEQVNLFLGPCCTSAVAAIAPLIKKNNQIAINFCTGSEKISEGSSNTIFHAQYSAETEASFNAKTMWNLGIRDPIIVYQDSEFGRAHEKAFRANFPGKVVSTLVYSEADREQLKSIILKMRRLKFDAIYVPLVETFLLGFMTELKKAGLRNQKAFGIYSVQLPALLDAEGINAEGIIYSYPEIPTTDNAASYFAKLAAEMLARKSSQCGNDLECIRRQLPKDYPFDSHNFLKSTLFLKIIRNGRFERYSAKE